MAVKPTLTPPGTQNGGRSHDPPATREWTPLGIRMVVGGAWTLSFGSKETSDFGMDGLKVWRGRASAGYRSVRRLVIYSGNGPYCSGPRAQFLARMVEFADRSGLEVRLVYYPPYHGTYDPVERCGSGPERKSGGALLTCLAVSLGYARRMTWPGRTPTADHPTGEYRDGVRLTRAQMKPLEARLERSETSPQYDITIRPRKTTGG